MAQSPQPHEHEAVPAGSDGVLYCTVHPTVETSLRCNKCGRPMCAKCAVKTPVGYTCRECVRGQQDKFYNIETRDYVVAAGVSFGLSLIAAFIVANLPLLLALLGAAFAGGAIAGAVRMATGRRRGRQMRYIVVGGIVAGAVPPALPLLGLLASGVPGAGLLLALAGPLLYAGVASVVAWGSFQYGGRNY